MREFINRYGWIVVGICVVSALATWFFTRGGIRTGNPAFAFYVDDVTGQESIQPGAEIPPLMNKDGKPTLVKEVKISCSGGGSPYVAYLLKYTDDAKAKQQQLNESTDNSRNAELQDAVSKGELVRRPTPGSPWVAGTSDEGQKIKEVRCSNGQPAIAVYPK